MRSHNSKLSIEWIKRSYIAREANFGNVSHRQKSVGTRYTCRTSKAALDGWGRAGIFAPGGALFCERGGNPMSLSSIGRRTLADVDWNKPWAASLQQVHSMEVLPHGTLECDDATLVSAVPCQSPLKRKQRRRAKCLHNAGLSA